MTTSNLENSITNNNTRQRERCEKRNMFVGPNPQKIKELLNSHPAFQLCTVDGLKWIDPHSLHCVDCPFGYLDAAFDWLMKNTPWHQHALRSLLDVRCHRWLLHIQDNIHFEDRWKIFSNQGVWLNPFNAHWQESVCTKSKIIDTTIHQLMAQSLGILDEQLLKKNEQTTKLLPAIVLQAALDKKNSEANDSMQDPVSASETIIRSSKPFIIDSAVSNDKSANKKTGAFLNHTKPNTGNKRPTALSRRHQAPHNAAISSPTIIMKDQAAANRHNKIEHEHYDFIDAPRRTRKIPLLDSQFLESENSGFFPTDGIRTEVFDPDKTKNIDFGPFAILGSIITPTAFPTTASEQQHAVSSDHNEQVSDRENICRIQIAGYKIIDLLGKGGMGSVHKAIQISMQREVAIKIMPLHVCADSNFADRFLHEARAAGKVNHPNVITCYDVGNEKGHLYMVLELVTGGDVAQLMRDTGGKLSRKRSLEIIRDCARGLRAIFNVGIIHRDIKPSNIFLTHDGIAKLADLGLAKNTSGSTQITKTGVCVGTPAFMSPEQIIGKMEVDIRSDIYSLGVTLYMMLTNENPYYAEDVWELFDYIIAGDVTPISDVLADIDAPLIEFVKRCMHTNPDQRFQTPSELLDALDQLQ